MFAVYELIDTACGMDEVMCGVAYETEAEAEAYMAELESSDVELYGEVVGQYYVGEVY